MSIKFKILFFIFFNSFLTFAQVETSVGLLPSLNFNQKLSNIYDLNLKIESRHLLFEKVPNQTNKLKYNYSLTDISLIAGKKIGLSNKILFGGLTRVEPNSFSIRTIQQLVLQNKIAHLRIAHRIGSDQTFSATESSEFRFRYRFTLEIPLSGRKVDEREFYFKNNMEIINSFQKKEYDIEFRIVPFIGYVIDKKHKIEFGIDNRFSSFISKKSNFTSWINFNFFM